MAFDKQMAYRENFCNIAANSKASMKPKYAIFIILLILVFLGAFYLGRQIDHRKKVSTPSAASLPLEKPALGPTEIDTLVPKTATSLPVFEQVDFSLPIELPYFESHEEVIAHSGFTLSYSEPHEQARWVAYTLSLDKLQAVASRTDRFLVDPSVREGSATASDYKGSGYDRGHLAPAADMAWSAQSMRESFYFSNMSPQVPAFNRGVWKRLEEQVRKWADANEHIYIVTGPVLEENLPTIGPNQVAVPKMYYKVVLDLASPEWKGIGFILRNEASTLPLSAFAVRIDSVQKVTGLDFFHYLPDSLEKTLETTLELQKWGLR
jgi:DNA/RNA endonuclease G (NUC1)